MRDARLSLARAAKLLAPGLILLVTAAPSADTYPRQPAVDARHYVFRLVLDDASAAIDAAADATFRLNAAVGHIDLDLIGPSDNGGMRVHGVALGGQPIAFVHEADRLRLTVPDTARPGDELTYTIRYHGTPADGLRVYTNIHGERVVFSEGWPNRARHWLPMIDHPYDKATGEMIVTAPAEWQVVSNGVLVEEVDLAGGRRRTHWRQSVPLASWLFALGAARFDAHHAGVVQGVPLQTWAFPQDRAAARALFEDTSRRAMDFFSTRIGPYPYEKLANVQASGFGGGMENATVIFYGEKGVASGRGPVVHEIAHQWFGNSVTEHDWDDVWLSEGFATYFAMLFVEHDEGRDAFVDALRRSRHTVLALGAKLPATPVIHANLDDMSSVLNGLVYQKGGWVLHMLRRAVGDDAFWRGIREYYRQYRDANASTADFRRTMEQVSGQPLGGFVEQWLRRGGHPVLAGQWWFDEAQREVVLTLRQTQSGAPYDLDVEVALAVAGERRLERVRMEGAAVTARLPAAARPTFIALDPDTWLLASTSLVERPPR